MTCWFCGKSDADVVRYAMVETPKREAFAAHAAGVARNDASSELVPLVIEASVGDL